MTALLERTPTAPAGRSSSNFTDEHLMEMIQARVRNGLDLLHERYAGLLKALSMKVLHNDADAEDLLQDVFLEIWDRAASYDSLKGRPLSWIATLTRCRSIDRLRRRETYCRVEDRFAEETKGHTDGWTHVHEELAQGERNAHLKRALSTLPEAQRNAIKLAYHEQMSQREIAAHTGIPLGTIKTRLELGLKKLAVSLRGFEDLLWADNPADGAENKARRDTAIPRASPITIRMKPNNRTLTGAALLGMMLLTVTFTFAQTAVKETTTTITSAGTISEFGPETIIIRSETSPEPIRYTYSKTTTYVDETGAPVSIQTVKSGLPVTVYYVKVGDKMLASKVIVRKAVVKAVPAIEEKKTTTTTTTTERK